MSSFQFPLRTRKKLRILMGIPECAIITAPPSAMHLDAAYRLHQESEMALSFSDGTGVYAWHHTAVSVKSAAKNEASRLNGLRGGRPRKEAKKPVDEPISILGPTLKVINRLEDEGIIKRPTIGGSIALMYYSQSAQTDDLDVFCYMVGQGDFVGLAPIYKRLEELEYEIEDLYVNIEGVDVLFLVSGPLEVLLQDALNTSIEIKVEGVPTRVFQYEYGLAVKAQANRSKDWIHIISAIESAEPDESKLMPILEKYGLVERWKRRTSDESV